jgi:hypothetical protein
MRFGLQSSAPSVERVIDDHPVLQHFVILRKIRRQTERDREQAAALRTQVVPRCIGAPDNCGQMVECRVLDIVDAQNGIE